MGNSECNAEDCAGREEEVSALGVERARRAEQKATLRRCFGRGLTNF
jgi:hypothetical protein